MNGSVLLVICIVPPLMLDSWLHLCVTSLESRMHRYHPTPYPYAAKKARLVAVRPAGKERKRWNNRHGQQIDQLAACDRSMVQCECVTASRATING